MGGGGAMRRVVVVVVVVVVEGQGCTNRTLKETNLRNVRIDGVPSRAWAPNVYT